MELTNKVAIITGASSGIGAAVARNLNEAGVNLVLTGRRESRLVELKKELNHAEVLPGDITTPALPDNLIQMALQRFGHCDIVFNNAGTVVMGTIEDIDIDEVCHMVRVNVEAAYRMAHVALKHFKSENSGFLLNTSSIVGTKVRPTGGAYAGTHRASEGLSQSFSTQPPLTAPVILPFSQISILTPGFLYEEPSKCTTVANTHLIPN